MTHSQESACDAMSGNDPVLAEIALRCEQAFLKWNPSPGRRIVNVGGAEYLSVRMARMFPECTVVHVDANVGLSGAAAGLTNLHVLSSDLRTANFLPESASAIIMVHALSAMPDTPEAIRTIAGWLEPGGHIFACDIGRRTSLLDWIVSRRRKRFHGIAEFRRMFEPAMLVVEESFAFNRGLSHAALCCKPLR
jgi:hypothetical protein